MFSAFFSLATWFVLSWFGLLLIVGMSLVLRSTWAPLHVRRGATCGACGYELDRLDGPCPECGAKLLRVGVNTPGAALRARGSLYLLAIGWLLAVASVATPTWMFVSQAVTTQQNQQIAGPIMGGMPSISACTLRPMPDGMRWNGGGGSSGLLSMRAVVNLNEPESARGVRIILDAAKGHPEGVEVISAGNGKWNVLPEWGDPIAEDAELDAELARRVFHTAGFNTEAAAIAKAIDELPGLASKMIESPHDPFGNTMFSSSVDDMPMLTSSSSSSDGTTSTYDIELGQFGFFGATGRPSRPKVSDVVRPPPESDSGDNTPEDIAWRIEVQSDIRVDEWKRPDGGSISMTLKTEADGEAWVEISVPDGAAKIREGGEVIAEVDSFDRDASLTLFEAAGLSRRSDGVGDAIKQLPVVPEIMLDEGRNLWGGFPSELSAFSIENVSHGGRTGPAMPGTGTGASGRLTPLEYAMWGTVVGSVVVYVAGLAVFVTIRRRTIRPRSAAA